MTIYNDFDALQEQGQKPIVQLFNQRASQPQPDDHSGFGELGSILLDVSTRTPAKVPSVDYSLTVLVEDSADAASWSIIHSFNFGEAGFESAEVDSPREFVRARVSSATGDWQIIVSVTAATVNAPDESGGGSLPTGWSQDDSDPANVDTHGGTINLSGGQVSTDDGTSSAAISPTDVEVISDSTDESYQFGIGDGFQSFPPAGVAAYNAAGDAGGTVALDAGGLSIVAVGEVDVTAGDGNGLTLLASGTLTANSADGGVVSMTGVDGVASAPDTSDGNPPCFSAGGDNGATVALDGGGLQVKNLAEGTDPSDAATVSQIGGSSPVQSATVSLTAADILALNSSPFTLVPSAGPGKIILPLQIFSYYTFVTTDYTIANELDIYGGITLTALTALMTGAPGETAVAVGVLGSNFNGPADQLPADTDLTISADESDPTDGDSLLAITTLYTVVNVPS